MDVREKLVELMCDVLEDGCIGHCNHTPCWKVTHAVGGLIANGVTVQEWISVKDRLPEEEGLYLVAVVNDHERRYSKTAWYHGHGNWFVHQKVTHWQYLPQPPKGE